MIHSLRAASNLVLGCCLLMAWACGGGGSSSGTGDLISPSITTQPHDLTVTEYQPASFQVVAGGSLPFRYQWMKNGTAISGATQATYSIPQVALSDAGSFTVQVNNMKGPAVVSDAAILTVNAYSGPPIILAQPQSQTVTAGGSVTFSVSAVGPGTLAYQWRKDSTDLSGKTGSSLTLADVALTDAGSYYVDITNTLGTTPSQAAVLTVQASGSGTFTHTGDLATSRAMHTATLLNNGQVLIAGGNNSGIGDLDTAELYDPDLGEFSSLPNTMTIPRFQHTATLLADGTVVLAGGQNNNGATDRVELFDPSDDSFTPIGTLAVPRTQHTATLLDDGTLLIVGGTNSNGPVDSAEIFDPVHGTSTPLISHMTVARYGHTITDLGSGQFLIAGGTNSLGGATDQAERLSGDPLTFTLLTSPMVSPRSFHTATLLEGGKVLLAGGQDGTSFATSSAELFNPADSTFSLCSQGLSDARWYHTATILADKTVLLAGGTNNQGALSSAEIYDPVADSFTTIPGLNTARSQHTATMMIDNGILFVGGYRSTNTLATAEVFH